MQTLHATGAYGRKPSMDDWLDGKDFRVANFGPYFSIRDVERMKSDGTYDVKFYDNNLQFVKGTPAFCLLL